MELEYISITKNPHYGARPEEFKGQVKYRSQHGTVEIQLDNKLSVEVLKLVAESITRASRDIADNLTAAVVEGAQDTNLLEQQ